jgi:hypothetical protein
MKALTVTGLVFVAAIIASVPISPQVTARGLEMRIDQAQAQVTYGRARRVARRVDRRIDRRAYYAARSGYGVAVYGSGYGYGPGYSYGPGYGYASAPGYGAGYGVVAAGPGRSCTVYPSGFRWCWTYF